MIARLVLRFAAAATIAAAAGLAVVALGFALYAWIEPYLGRAGAAACVALASALLAALVALLIFGLGGGYREPARRSESLTDRLAGLVRDRPLMAAGAAIAAGWIFIRNPALASVVVAAFSERGRDRRR